MNLSEYISSGVLEAYALGELSDQERNEVERTVLQYPEWREELRQIEAAQESFVIDLAIGPAAAVKENIFKIIEREETGSKLETVSWPTSWMKYSLAATIALTLVSSTLAFRYYYRWKQADTSLTELLAQNQRIASEYNAVNQRLDKIESDLRITTSPNFKRTVLNGTENAPESIAFVYWSSSTHDVYLSIEKLRELTQEKQYQLWAIVDNKPVDAGVFDLTFSGLVKMKNISGATAFAVTVEKRGGSITPSLETMQVIGNVDKG